MKLTRTIYYCVYTNGQAGFDQRHGPFKTLQEAKNAAKSLAAQGFHGMIEKHQESKQDKGPVWQTDWQGWHEKAIEPLDEYF